MYCNTSDKFQTWISKTLLHFRLVLACVLTFNHCHTTAHIAKPDTHACVQPFTHTTGAVDTAAPAWEP